MEVRVKTARLIGPLLSAFVGVVFPLVGLLLWKHAEPGTGQTRRWWLTREGLQMNWAVPVYITTLYSEISE